MPFVVDASAALTWCFADEATPASQALLASLETDHAMAPAMWPSEVANALLMAARRGRATQQEVDGHVFDLLTLPVRLDHPPDLVVLGITMALARGNRLTIYDAAYLELALRLKLPLASGDNDLRVAARAEGVKVLL